MKEIIAIMQATYRMSTHLPYDQQHSPYYAGYPESEEYNNYDESEQIVHLYPSLESYDSQTHVANWLSPTKTMVHSTTPEKSPNLDFGYVAPAQAINIGEPWSMNAFNYDQDTSSTIPLAHNDIQSQDLKAWSRQRHGDVLVRDLDSELTAEFSIHTTNQENFNGESYLHPRYSYPQPVLDYDNSSLVTSCSRRLSDASTSLSDNVILNESNDKFQAQERSFTAPVFDQATNQWAPSASATTTRNVSPLISPLPPSNTRIGKAPLSPRPSLRAAPYSQGGRIKRWSTGNVPKSQANITDMMGFVPMTSYPTQSVYEVENLQFQQHPTHRCSPEAHAHSKSLDAPIQYSSTTYDNIAAYSEKPSYTTNVYSSPSTRQQHHHQSYSGQLPYLGMLQSNVHFQHRYSDLSDSPDLYGALSKGQSDPPPEDMNPEDPDMIPYEQELRFEGDLYTPKWVRNHGNKREGWCGFCSPGRWLVLKNSAFWYDKSFSHGISAATGSSFKEPEEIRRMDGNPEVWEGLCHSCHDWVSLVSSKKKGTTWFRHAYKCHSHIKTHHKDAPKRRRESNQNRNAPPRKPKTSP